MSYCVISTKMKIPCQKLSFMIFKPKLGTLRHHHIARANTADVTPNSEPHCKDDPASKQSVPR